MYKIKIRRIGEKDIDEFFNLLSKLLKSHFSEYSEKTKEFMLTSEKAWSKKKYKKIIGDQSRILLGAWVENQIIGLLDAELMIGGVSLCTWLMIDPRFQRRGIGRKLMEFWEKESNIYGIHSLFLYSSKFNIPFYEKNGFELVGLHKKGWFGSDDYILTKLIQEPKEENYLR